MPHPWVPFDALTIGSSHASQVSVTAPAPSSAPRVPPDILTYTYASRMVYVTPGETYDQAIDIAKESFLELKDVERERISFEIRVSLKNQRVFRTAGIGRTAWSAVVPSLVRYEIVEIRVAPLPPKARFEPVYVSEKGWISDWQTDSETNFEPQNSSSKSHWADKLSAPLTSHALTTPPNINNVPAVTGDSQDNSHGTADMEQDPPELLSPAETVHGPQEGLARAMRSWGNDPQDNH